MMQSAHMKHRPQGDLPRQVYDAAETARIESLGANAMRGTADNLACAPISTSSSNP
jgi:cobaltochelatase CobT